MERTPLLIIYTGNGKGKTTAAMGLVFRALGHTAQCAVLQFIKPEKLVTGEKIVAQKLGVLWENYGEGFLWKVSDEELSRQACQQGWQRAKELIIQQKHAMIVLDEFTYPIEQGYISHTEVVDFFATYKRGKQTPHVVITGRNAAQPLIEIADMVHEIVEVKHPWRLAKVKAQPMIEY